jgi:hypothetical protein
VQWVPTAENVLADAMSRVKDHGNWTVTQVVFSEAERRWGPHSVDRMATAENAKCVRYNAWRYGPGVETVNAFTVGWGGENNWVAPPLAMIGLVIRHVVQSRAVATLFIPSWVNMWTPLLDRITVERRLYSEDPELLCLPEPNGGQEILKNRFWRMMLVRVDGGRG